MRWDNLFDDLESQLALEITAEEADIAAEEERLRLGRLGLRDRLMAVHRLSSGVEARTLRLELLDGAHLTVIPSSFGRDWFSGELVDNSGRRPGCVVSLGGIGSIAFTREQLHLSLTPADGREGTGALSDKLGFSFVLRDLCRRRQPIDLHLTVGHLFGTIDRVGRDHLDLAVHERGVARRETVVQGYRVVRLDQVLVIRL